eukprot:CAMPEP_0182428944 /NCGR_PEP_ID=MMETSP1167-20130531/24828_1 /TAXON_ID=2988 /ORGANISM="Mallomonas Sp, Strain CCMP3275" /LENGTH=202 /DNA_ID=CAMNT_0024612183 /DNA_START=79 /DNA_END=687 /DNA_ORIENTATION=+
MRLYLLVVIVACAVDVSNAFVANYRQFRKLSSFKHKIQLQMSGEDESPKNNSPSPVSATSTSAESKSNESVESPVEETDEEKYKREKLAEIAEKKAQEVFVTRITGKYECQACGYIYNEANGLAKRNIAPGTPWEEIEKFRCPECGAGKKYFVPETETLSGFKQNLNYGFGGNAMTGESKGLLIFGSLAGFFVLFLAGYLLE